MSARRHVRDVIDLLAKARDAILGLREDLDQLRTAAIAKAQQQDAAIADLQARVSALEVKVP